MERKAKDHQMDFCTDATKMRETETETEMGIGIVKSEFNLRL